jgi:hypothetical protein
MCIKSRDAQFANFYRRFNKKGTFFKAPFYYAESRLNYLLLSTVHFATAGARSF